MPSRLRIPNLLIACLLCFSSLGLSPARSEARAPAPPAPVARFWASHCVTCDLANYYNNNLMSMDLDSQGYPHLAYSVAISTTQGITSSLMTSYQDAQGWHSLVVDPLSTPGSTHSVYSLESRVDANGYEHILYSISDYTIKYAYQDMNGWHVQTIFSQADLNYGGVIPGGVNVTSMALNPAGRPGAIVAADINRGLDEFFYIYLTDTGWQKEAIGGNFESNALAYDAAGQPHVAFTRQVTDLYVLYHIYRGPLFWYPEEEVAQLGGPQVDLAIDSSGGLRILSGGVGIAPAGFSAYYPTEYFHKVAVAWVRETVDKTSASDLFLRLDALGNPLVAYFSTIPNPITPSDSIVKAYVGYAFRNQAGWEKGQIYSPALWYPSTLSMAVDGSGGVHFAFNDNDTYQLLYLYPSTPTNFIYLPFIGR